MWKQETLEDKSLTDLYNLIGTRAADYSHEERLKEIEKWEETLAED